MIAYLTLYLSFAWITVSGVAKSLRRSNIAWGITGFILILFVGLRICGGDYPNYHRRFLEMQYLSFDDLFSTGDIGYKILSYFVYNWGFDFWVLTLISATISIIGLIKFLKRQVNPWLGLVIAIPYLIIVVYMGYMRQGIALGFIMWAIVKLDQNQFISFLFFIFLAVIFHKSAILMVSYGIFYKKSGRFLKFTAIALAGVGLWFAFLEKSSTELWNNYVEAGMVSHGAMIRSFLNAIPAFLLLKYRKKFKKEFKDYNFWKMIAISALLTIPLIPFASTAVDRMALYFLPLQIVVWTRIPLILKGKISTKHITLFIVLLYFFDLVVWLTFGVNSFYWLPYRNLMWSGIL